MDPITYLPAVEQVKKQFGIERIVTVADKAMNSTRNVLDAFKKGDGWLFSSKFRWQKGSPKDIQNFILNRNGWEYNAKMTFAKKSIVRSRTLGNSIQVQEKVVITWREKYARREAICRDGAISYANSLRNPEKYRASMRKGGKKYLKIILQDVKTGELVLAHPFLNIDERLVEFDAQFDGMNVITTSEINMSDDEIIATYSELNKIEDCFRVTKTNLKTRPVYVWTKEHIESHFLSCFIALTSLKILMHRTQGKISIHRAIEAMRSASVKHIEKSYYETSANDDFISLVGKFGLNYTAEVQTIDVINKIRTLKITRS